MSDNRNPHIKNVKDAAVRELKHGKKFDGIAKRLAAGTGAKQLGCSWFEIPPGKQAFPHHSHFANEEAFFILSGEGTVRLGDERFPVSAGDYIACPGGEMAHSLINTGKEPLRYLGISTAHGTDIVVYPDSKKFACAGGVDAQKGLLAAPFRKLFKDDRENADYYLDEE